MKGYKRLTERRSGAVIDNCGNCPNVNNKQGCTDKKCYEIIKNRLADLEDKIESGELISTKEVGDTEIEFFVKHNESVRKNTATDIFSWIYKNLVNLNFITGNVEINLSALNNFAKTYGVDVFDIFKQGGGKQ